jgi:hypothetical protein
LWQTSIEQLGKMARLDEEELNSLSSQIRGHLKGSQYECSSLTLLGGGSANFVYRGVLVTPIPSGAETVIVKHTTGFLAVSRDFKIDVSRCVRNLRTIFEPDD